MSDVRPITISVVTPSYKQPEWLKLCAASVADQTGENLTVEHIVQDCPSGDSLSGPEIAEVLKPFPNARLYTEKDAGMYDAINRGWDKATGDILCWLNCDEQYLPGALKFVHDYFAAHPGVDVLLAGSLVVDGEGKYICHRHSLVPHPWHVWYRFPVLTSSMFLRRRVIHERGLYFDTRWRDLGDFHWVLSLLKNRVPMGVSAVVTSSFADTGENMNLKPNALREKAETELMRPGWLRFFKPVWILHHRLRRLAAGHFSVQPTSYDIYTLKNPAARAHFDVPAPTAVWWNRM